MAVDVKQLVIKGTILQPQESPTEPVSVDEADQVGVDDEEILARSQRNWREERRQWEER